jgi:hypothetical protein
MSLWTPGGEHRVPREQDERPAEPAPRLEPGAPDFDGADPLADLSPEEREEARLLAAEMAEVRRQLAEAPAEVVVANHVMGMYELAAIHLGHQPPNLDRARLAIDAMGLVVEGLPGRLGEAEPTLREALRQIRSVYVQLVNAGQPPPADEPADEPAPEG